MVNPGHRSRGCQPCRTAKVKCDEAAPACGRCQRTGRTCPGYGREAPSFRSMNVASATKVERRVQKQLARRERENSPPPPPKRDRADSLPPMDVSSPFLNGDAMLSPQPTMDWAEQSVLHFFNEVVMGPDRLHAAWGNFEWLPSLYRKSRAMHLTKAVQAAALANLAMISTITNLEHMARQKYVAALHDLGSAMNDPLSRTTDEALATMTILGTYEVISGDTPLTELFHGHFRGQSMILQKRQHQPSKGNSLFGSTNRTLMWRDMASHRRPQLCLAEWPSATYSSNLGEKSARFTVRIVDILGRIRGFISHDSGPSPARFVENDAITSDATRLHREIEAYFDSESKEWLPWSLPQRFNMPSPIVITDAVRQLPDFVEPASGIFDDLLPPEFPSRIDIYPTLTVAFLWNTLRCAWTQLLLGMAELTVHSHTHRLAPSNLPPIGGIYGMIGSLIEDICAAVPFSMGDVGEKGYLGGRRDQPKLGALWLLWVLHKACSISCLDHRIRAWMVSVFDRVGTHGLRQGHVLAKMYASGQLPRGISRESSLLGDPHSPQPSPQWLHVRERDEP